MNELDLLDAIRNPYAWPGGYAKVLLMRDGESLCMKCAESERKRILEEFAYPCDQAWLPAAVYVNWEGIEVCAHCGNPIPAEYE